LRNLLLILARSRAIGTLLEVVSLTLSARELARWRPILYAITRFK
jgi:hypothetical protein